MTTRIIKLDTNTLVFVQRIPLLMSCQDISIVFKDKSCGFRYCFDRNFQGKTNFWRILLILSYSLMKDDQCSSYNCDTFLNINIVPFRFFLSRIQRHTYFFLILTDCDLRIRYNFFLIGTTVGHGLVRMKENLKPQRFIFKNN